MAPKASDAAMAREGSKGGIGAAIGTGVLGFFLWLTFGYGSSILYTIISAWILYFQTTNTEQAIGVVVGFSLYSSLYLIIQVSSLIVALYRTGGSMVRALADIGTSLLPGIPLIILGTMSVMGGFSPTWLTYVVGLLTACTVAIDILVVLLFMRATQKTFEATAPHPH